MKRGEIWSAAARGDYTGKPRPVVIVQDDRFDSTGSVTVCSMTSTLVDAPLLRIRIEPDPVNGLARRSDLMVDKLVTVRRERLGEHIGRLDAADMVRLERALLVFLGLA